MTPRPSVPGVQIEGVKELDARNIDQWHGWSLRTPPLMQHLKIVLTIPLDDALRDSPSHRGRW